MFPIPIKPFEFNLIERVSEESRAKGREKERGNDSEEIGGRKPLSVVTLLHVLGPIDCSAPLTLSNLKQQAVVAPCKASACARVPKNTWLCHWNASGASTAHYW